MKSQKTSTTHSDVNSKQSVGPIIVGHFAWLCREKCWRIIIYDTTLEVKRGPS